MTRALRVLPLVGAPFLSIYLLGLVLSHVQALPLIGTGQGAEVSRYFLTLIAMLIAALVGIAIMSAADVIAIVATVQRRQRGWTITLIGALALLYASVFLMLAFPALTQFLATLLFSSTYIWFGEVPLLAVALATLSGVLVLIYSFLRSPSASSPAGQMAEG
jgi:hypothetical protein